MEQNEKNWFNDDWIASLYKEQFTIEYAGHEFRFNARLAMGVMLKYKNLSPEEQTMMGISLLAISPPISLEQVKKMPSDFISLVGTKMQCLTNIDELKKKV
jgi:hypothetical protein